MITNISIASVFVKDIDESKAFYIDVLGFEEHTDITLGDGYRWCTVKHPNQPELQVHLTIPGPPISPDMVAAMKRAQDEGGLFGLGMAVDDCRKTYDELQAKGVRVHPAAGGAAVRGGGRSPGQLGQLDGAGRGACVHPGRLRLRQPAARRATAPGLDLRSI